MISKIDASQGVLAARPSRGFSLRETECVESSAPVILRCERSEPRRMDHGPCSSFEARKSAHLRVNAIAFIPGMTGESASRLPLNRQAVLLRQILQRHLRPGADVLDHFGGGERAETAGIFMAGV